MGPYLVQLRDRGGAREKQSFDVPEGRKPLPTTESTAPPPFRFVIPFATSPPNSRLFWYALTKRCPNNDTDRSAACRHPPAAGTAKTYTVRISYRISLSARGPKECCCSPHKGTTARYDANPSTSFAYYCPRPVTYPLWRCLVYYRPANGPGHKEVLYI